MKFFLNKHSHLYAVVFSKHIFKHIQNVFTPYCTTDKETDESWIYNMTNQFWVGLGSRAEL
jgi:hypothetical protein